jgi:hypothetical protein
MAVPLKVVTTENALALSPELREFLIQRIAVRGAAGRISRLHREFAHAEESARSAVCDNEIASFALRTATLACDHLACS